MYVVFQNVKRNPILGIHDVRTHGNQSVGLVCRIISELDYLANYIVSELIKSIVPNLYEIYVRENHTYH